MIFISGKEGHDKIYRCKYVIDFVKVGVKLRSSDMMPTRIDVWKILLSMQSVSQILLCSEYPSFFSRRVKRPGRGVYHSPPLSAEVKEYLELYLYSPICLLGLAGTN